MTVAVDATVCLDFPGLGCYDYEKSNTKLLEGVISLHMADALISPAVGGTMWAASAGIVALSARRVERDLDESRIPLMGVLGAFIFAAQMINFAIPGTGSSGHLGGGIILAILLGPYAGFLTLASILTIQALFFADGGLLALGCNIFNLGFFPCFIAYPMFYRAFTQRNLSPGRIFAGAFVASVIGLQLGALGVVAETTFSGISSLPFKTFIWFMQPIHLAIGIIEGLVSGAVVLFLRQARPELLEGPKTGDGGSKLKQKSTWVFVGIFAFALLLGGFVSRFASANPDGLEWSVSLTAGHSEPNLSGGVHQNLSKLQQRTALLPDYGFKEKTVSVVAERGGTSLSGVIGGILTLLSVAGVGVFLRWIKKINTR